MPGGVPGGLLPRQRYRDPQGGLKGYRFSRAASRCRGDLGSDCRIEASPCEFGSMLRASRHRFCGACERVMKSAGRARSAG